MSTLGRKMKCLGIDIGGTFTDFIYLDSENEVVSVHKVSSTPLNQSIGVKNGLSKLSTTLDDLDVVVHGTTVATNAILEHKGAKTALITTEGFSDVIEIGRQNRINLYSLYPKRVAPLVPSKLRFGVIVSVLNMPKNRERNWGIRPFGPDNLFNGNKG